MVRLSGTWQAMSGSGHRVQSLVANNQACLVSLPSPGNSTITAALFKTDYQVQPIQVMALPLQALGHRRKVSANFIVTTVTRLCVASSAGAIGTMAATREC